MIGNNSVESIHVGRLSEILALEHGASPVKAKQIRIAATLHDIGKRKISSSILDKPGKLTEAEFEIIKTHTLLGAEMLSSMQGELGEMARTCCEFHHEWYNGGGYWGKRTDDLPFFVPYVAVSDVFTALVSARSYKEAWPPENAMDYIQKQAGTQFAPELVEVFLWLVQHDKRVSAVFHGRCQS